MKHVGGVQGICDTCRGPILTDQSVATIFPRSQKVHADLRICMAYISEDLSIVRERLERHIDVDHAGEST